MTNIYQSDVRSLSDEELRLLSEELSDAYQHAYGDDGDAYWTDDEAETRYWEMRHEIRRRWGIAHPEWESAPLSELVAESLRMLASNLVAARAINQRYDSEFSATGKKVGDTIKVSRLPRAPWLSISVQ